MYPGIPYWKGDKLSGHSYWLIGRGPQSWLLARWLMTNTPWTVKLLLRPALLGRKSAEICFWFEEVVSKMEAPCFFLLWKQICIWLPLHRKPCQIYKNSFTEDIPWIFKLKSCSPTWKSMKHRRVKIAFALCLFDSPLVLVFLLYFLCLSSHLHGIFHISTVLAPARLFLVFDPGTVLVGIHV